MTGPHSDTEAAPVAPDAGDGGFDTLFQPETAADSTPAAPWRILVVDDEGDVHAMMRLTLESLRIDGRGLELLHASSRREAVEVLTTNQDVALILLDVVMETPHAGLDLVRDVRERLGNRTAHITILTGQPGQAPEQAVVEAYEINDYRLKSELSAEKLTTMVYSALRTYRAMRELFASREHLEQTAAQLRQTKQRYEDLYDDAPDMYISVDAQSARIVQCNQTLVNTLGYHSKEEILGRAIFSMYHPDSQAQARAAFRRFVETGVVKDAELKLLRRDGSPLDVSLNVKALCDEQGRIRHSHSAWRDITQWVTARAELEAAEERNRLLLESVTEGIIGVDTDGCCTFVNPAGLRILGFRRDELLGRPIHPLIHHTDAGGRERPARDCPILDSLAKGEEVNRHDEMLWRRDGSAIYVEYSSVPFRKAGVVAGSVIIFHDVSARREAEEKIEYLAFHDPLTGLTNRTMFKRMLEQALAHMARNRSRFALHMIDLDHFKEVNDSLGHPIGDQLLCAVADRIGGFVRATDVFARLGGDEFALLQSRLGQTADASVMAAKVLEVVSREFELDGHAVRTNASIGIVVPEPGECSADELLSRADVALYRAKDYGRGTLAFFEDTMNRELLDEMRVSAELSRAVEQEEFFVVYQPQISLRQRRLVGMEALVRWRHPTRGVLQPADFLRIAEKRGHIGAISDQVLRKACRQISQWSKRGLDPVRVAVNLCAQQLRDPAFADKILAVLDAESVSPGRLELEFTETVLIEADLRTQADISRLSEYGVRFAIDDFGTGFSSMQYLRRFHVDKLKIDREFVCDVTADRNDAEIVKATIALGSALGLDTIAEGVETEEQAAFLRRHGCLEAQGYLFSRPLEIDEIEKIWLQ